MSLDYLAALVRESARFRAVLADVPSDTRVPTCPDWDADDLLWHLAEVQWFWATIVREGVDGPGADALKPSRPADRAALQAFYDDASAELARVLRSKSPSDPAWSWSAEQTVGFTYRRQAHEALIHRLDAELAAGQRTPLDPALALDGVDEAMRIMYGGHPDWSTFTPAEGQALRITATDSGSSWRFTLGQIVGTAPDGKHYDQPDLGVDAFDDGSPVIAEITGAAVDLDCWLWQREAQDPIETTGDADALATFLSLISEGIS